MVFTDIRHPIEDKYDNLKTEYEELATEVESD
jgi:hypothetical protein